jgi:hypothetical protein
MSNLLLSIQKNDFEKVLQLRGYQRPYFTKKADELRIPQQIKGSGIYMETNLSSNQIARICLEMIKLFGYSEKDFNIEAH